MGKRNMIQYRCKRAGSVTPWLVLSLLAIVGIVALGMDGGRMVEERRHAQATADAAALSAAVQNYNDFFNSTSLARQSALSTAADNGYANDGVQSIVTVHSPPTSGAYTGKADCFEVIVQSNLPATFGASCTGKPLAVTASRPWVAVAGPGRSASWLPQSHRRQCVHHHRHRRLCRPQCADLRQLQRSGRLQPEGPRTDCRQLLPRRRRVCQLIRGPPAGQDEHRRRSEPRSAGALPRAQPGQLLGAEQEPEDHQFDLAHDLAARGLRRRHLDQRRVHRHDVAGHLHHGRRRLSGSRGRDGRSAWKLDDFWHIGTQHGRADHFQYQASSPLCRRASGTHQGFSIFQDRGMAQPVSLTGFGVTSIRARRASRGAVSSELTGLKPRVGADTLGGRLHRWHDYRRRRRRHQHQPRPARYVRAPDVTLLE